MSVFTPDYWRKSAAMLKKSRVIAFAGIVCAFSVALEMMPIYLMGPTLKLYFSFLFVGLGAYVYGPVVAMLAGAVIDTVGFLLASYGEPYFPGFLITAVVSGLVYGLLLYGQKVSLWRCLLTKGIINFAINVALGSVWKAMLYGKGYLYYFTTGLWKNAVLLPVEAALMLMVLGFAQRQKLAQKYILK